jgi:serine/threonine-protein kinase
MPPTVGQVINNKYRLLRHIGDGGMGSVYEARHETLGTTVALKFLHLEFSRREGLVQRFLQEARASARIQSPHVVRVADVDQTPDGDVFIVLEYLEGKTLQALYEELYRGGRRLSYAEALDYAEQMLDGVEAAHEAGIVHRDLKPDNVMITLDAKGASLLKLLDFGIAKLKAIGAGAPGPHGGQPHAPGLTRPGVMMGTPEYMAPEQASSADTVDARADIFSLGVIIFEMLGGQRPVGGDDPHELAAAYRSGQISQLVDLVPGVAPELAAAVHRAMAVEPRDRFATAGEMRDAIEPFAAAVRAPSPSRLRAGGTIGVSEIAPSRIRPAPPASPPPPTTGGPASSGVAAPAIPVAAVVAPRPGGVAKTWPPDEDPPGYDGGSAPKPSPAVQGTMVDEVAPLTSMPSEVARDRTHRMDDLYAPAPFPAIRDLAPASVVAPSAPRPGRRRRRGTLTPLGVVITAACAAGVIVGGVYLASRSTSTKDRDEDPPHATATPPVPAAPADPPSPAPADPPPFVPPAPAPPPSPRAGPQGPRPRPSPSAMPSATPSATPSSDPSPGLVLPFPIPNPFQPAPQSPGSGTPKQQDPPPLFPLP